MTRTVYCRQSVFNSQKNFEHVTTTPPKTDNRIIATKSSTNAFMVNSFDKNPPVKIIKNGCRLLKDKPRLVNNIGVVWVFYVEKITRTMPYF